MTDSNEASERDAHFLRRSFEVARRAMTHGNHPFGAVLVDHAGNVLLEAENGYMPLRDGTAHAERLLATKACTTLDAETRKSNVKGNVSGAKSLGAAFAVKAKAAGITSVVFDRNGRLYHGRVKTFADAAREGGLQF